MNRRRFLAAAGGAPFLSRLTYAQPQVETPERKWFLQEVCAAEPPHPDPIQLQPAFPVSPEPAPGIELPVFHPPGGAVVQRPLWSKIQHDNAYLNKLRTAYHRLYESKDHQDPWSLLYNVRLHEYYCGTKNIHGNWLFLPFHRAMLHFHERSLQIALNDDKSFRLPVWDWEAEPGGFGQKIPPFYEQLGFPSFLSGSCLRIPNRQFVEVTEPMLQAWLAGGFEDFFGGANAPGLASSGPHSNIHGFAVGGVMGNLGISPADPLFYTHHANVDRYWSAWSNLNQGTSADYWGKDAALYMPDMSGKPTTINPKDLMDETKLGYSYSRPQGFAVSKLAPGEYLSDLSALPSQVLRLLLAALRNGGSQIRMSDVLRMVAGIPGKIGGASNLAELWANANGASAGLQVHLPVDVPADSSTHYYLVELTRDSVTKVNLGGFGVMGHSHDHDGLYDDHGRLSAAALDTSIFTLLFQTEGPLTLSYGPTDQENVSGPSIAPGEHRQIPLDKVGFRLLYPKTYTEAWKAIPSF